MGMRRLKISTRTSGAFSLGMSVKEGARNVAVYALRVGGGGGVFGPLVPAILVAVPRRWGIVSSLLPGCPRSAFCVFKRQPFHQRR